MVYSGEVPMSPYTTPSATMAMAGVILSGRTGDGSTSGRRTLAGGLVKFRGLLLLRLVLLDERLSLFLVRTLCETFGACVYVAA